MNAARVVSYKVPCMSDTRESGHMWLHFEMAHRAETSQSAPELHL